MIESRQLYKSQTYWTYKSMESSKTFVRKERWHQDILPEYMQLIDLRVQDDDDGEMSKDGAVLVFVAAQAAF